MSSPVKGEPLKVLYVSWRFPKLSESFVSNEVRLVRARGHEVRVFSVRRPHDARLEPDQVPVSYGFSAPISIRALLGAHFPQPRRLASRSSDDVIGVIVGLLGIMRIGRWRPDVIHCHFVHRPASAALRMAEMLRVPCTLVAHAGDWTVEIDRSELTRKVRASSHVITISTEAAREIAQRTSASNISIQRAVFRMHPTVRMPMEGFHVVVVARLAPKKGIDVLLTSLFQLRDRIPGLRCTIVGEGPLGAELRALSTTLYLDDIVTFAGAVTQEQTQQVVASADVFTLPCRRLPNGDADGIPVALMEAIATGIPVVTTPVAGIPDLIVDSVSGSLVPQDDPSALADAIYRIFQSPERAISMSSSALDRLAREFDPDLQISRLEAVWLGAIQSGPRYA